MSQVDAAAVSTLSVVLLGTCVFFRKRTYKARLRRQRRSKSEEEAEAVRRKSREEEEEARRYAEGVAAVRATKEGFEPNDLELIQFRYAWTEQALLRIAKKSMSFEETNSTYPRTASGGALPYLRVGRRLLTGSRIREYIVRVSEMDASLSSSDIAKLEALHALVASVENLIVQLRWGDPATVKRKTDPEVGRRIPQPLRWFALRTHKSEMMQRIRCAREPHLTQSQVLERIMRGFRALDEHLNEAGDVSGGSFFFGDRPRSIDAACFGIVAVAMNERLGLRTLVQRECLYLSEFYAKMRSAYFDGWPKTTNELVGDGSYRPALSSPRLPVPSSSVGNEDFFEVDDAADAETEKMEFNRFSQAWIEGTCVVIGSLILSNFVPPRRAVAAGLVSGALLAKYAPVVF